MFIHLYLYKCLNFVYIRHTETTKSYLPSPPIRSSLKTATAFVLLKEWAEKQ